MKRALSIVLVLVLLVSIAPMSVFAADNGYDTITGTIMFNAGHDDMETDHPCPFTYSDGYFTETAYKYRQDLAAVTMAMCLAAGNVADPERYKEGPANLEDFFEQIGFEDFEANADFTNRPGRNTFGVGIANKEIRVNGEKYTVIAVGLRGCGYYAEWAGDLNVGLEGEHTGFAICREKALAFIQTYLAKHSEISGKIKLWCTGYSRGAAGANLLGGALDDMYLSGASVGKNVTLSPKDMYIYTFEAPMGADASKVSGRIYENIHNVINYNDLVVRVAPDCMGFARYGVDHVMPSAKLDSNYAQLKESMLKVFSTFENAGKYRIDDFKYVTVTPGATADKIISSIRGDVMTQGEFLDKFVEKLFTKVFTTRAEVCADAEADGEGTTAGRLARFVAQSAFYQMEQPYSERNLLVCLNGNSDPAVVDALMTDVEQSPWLNITDLNTLNNADPALSGDDAAAIVPQSDGINDATQANLRQTLNTLAASTNDIKRFNASILTDVADDAWYRPELVYAYENGLVNGTTANTFSPNAIVTRAQVVTVLYRMADSPSVSGMKCPFADNTAAWSRDAITWAYNAGVANGFTDSRFAGSATVTREQLAAFLFRYADKVISGGTLKAPLSYADSFRDASSVSAYAVPAMRWANVNGIINGRTGGILDPTGSATRAEFTCMISRFSMAN
ncbi:MAG: hypothetical protein BHW36_06610 [Firmicutes bacterium CAG:24053_14]|nr:MAG: hypothetical protein BHW36_06610 [Firmicutes bacterium CAG:24053_14]